MSSHLLYDTQIESVNRAFSKQSENFDEEDLANPILQAMRKQVYDHVDALGLKPSSRILELNAGTGIDAHHFVRQGHTVHATDLSDGMVNKIAQRIQRFSLENVLSCQQLSYTELDELATSSFDFVFSNFGGLNCVDDLQKVTRHLRGHLNNGALITWVIMPPVCPIEIASILRGNVKSAFRRFNRGGVISHLEGEFFKTYYHSLADIKAAFQSGFKFLKSEGLGSLSTQPHQERFARNHKGLYRMMCALDSGLREHFPFNQWADHIIVSFRYESS